MSLSGQQQRRQQVFSGQSQRYDYVRCSVYHRLDIDDARTRTQPVPFTAPRRCAKASPYSITERRVPEPISVLCSQPAGDVSHKPGGRLPLLSARPAVTPATLRGLLPILLPGEQRHDGCEQFA